MLACLPFMIWGLSVGISPRHWLYALTFMHMSIGEGVSLAGVFVAGGLYYWILAATIVKRFHDLNLSGWTTLVYLVPVGVAVFEATDMHLTGWNLPINAARYFYPFLLLAEGSLSVWGLLAFFLAPCVFLILLILQGSLKGTAEPAKMLVTKFVIATLALVVCGFAEAGYSYYDVYREVDSAADLLSFSMNVQRVNYSGTGAFEIEGCTLFLADKDGKQKFDLPLLSSSVVGGRIRTQHFGILKVKWTPYSLEGFSILATRRQIAKLQAVQSAHQ
jgi:uncharacterized membrane protein YhaH (DUF805 family)